MFSKVLIANRGEIAVRVQQTLQGMGISTVAVYSDTDRAAPHVAMAGEAYSLDGLTAPETYLDQGKLLAVARRSGAEAVHPGYGFLSENPEFALACQREGVVFIGPGPASMEALGDKLRAKATASAAAVPVVPSSGVCHGLDAALEEFVAAQGYPLLVKAVAGGGGRGMRVVNAPEELGPSLETASREAAASFGDGRVFLEKFVANGRHVEIQMLADQHGKTVHLLERECSVQRRHQKLVEETPSPAVDPELRGRMGQAAVRLVEAAGYSNAGTVEFLLDPETGRFYFLEVNTRLQVEHPITEAVLGLDLVEWQIRIAAGERLTLTQSEILATGHAIECRICAEDPYNGFAPAAGRLALWEPPSGPGLRLDSGVAQGTEVSSYFDSLLAKLIAWGPDRQTSLRRMASALARFQVLGVVTNAAFLRDVITHPKFQAGDYDTRFLERETGLAQPGAGEDVLRGAEAVAGWAAGSVPEKGAGAASRSTIEADSSPWQALGGQRFP